MISLHGQANRIAFPMSSSTNHYCHCLIVSSAVQIRFHKMLNSLTSRNMKQRQKAIKVKLGLGTWLLLAVGVWMVYQLRVLVNHKLSNENGSSVKDETLIEQLKLGRKGLILSDSETRKPDEKGEAEAMEKDENQQEMEQESEDLVGVVDKGGDADDEELGVVRFDDPIEEIESLNEDDDEGDDNATTDQHSDGEDDKVETKISEVS